MKYYFLIISFISFLLFIKLNSGCELCSGTWYQSCAPSLIYCDLKYPVQAYDFCASPFYWGCRMGFYAGKFYQCACPYGLCFCLGPETKWYSSPRYDGQVCKVKCGILCENSIEGKWDLSEGKCVTECKDSSLMSEGPFETKYVTADGVVHDGDYKCESACGADTKCDEKGFLEQCGSDVVCTEGRCEIVKSVCASDCECCTIYDTDRGLNFLVKGTTQGLKKGLCTVAGDYCVSSTTLVEYYILPIYESLDSVTYDCSQRTDGNIRCVDGHCGCLSDDDCKKFDPNSYCDPNTKTCKAICSKPCNSNDDCKGSFETACCKNGLAAYCNPKTKTCDCFTSCTAETMCQSGYCCLYSISRDLPKECVPRWNIISYQGKSYLCDPPNWINEENSNSKNLVEIIIEKINSLLQPLSFFISHFKQVNFFASNIPVEIIS